MRHIIILGVALTGVFIAGCASEHSSNTSQTESTPSAKSQANNWIYDTPDTQAKSGSSAAAQPTTSSTNTASPAIVTQPAPATIAVADSGQVYTVKSGDSLWKIARLHATTVNKIKILNQLNSDVIRVGQQLKLPAN